MTEIMPVPRNLILLSYQQGACVRSLQQKAAPVCVVHTGAALLYVSISSS